ncbi:MAG: carbon starvation CstA family protein [Synergistaceae bacterium]|nr:carbon starvation CstA family protein [Synergistaceae bacterium]
MLTFLIALASLILGYVFYGAFVEKIFAPDDRETPAVAHPDDVDFVPMEPWRIFLIQVLNIAGLSPIFGALSGALWGPAVYFWIVFGAIFAGAVHDYLSGMISERNNGASISETVGIYLGPSVKTAARVFTVVMLVLVGTTFSTSPAEFLAMISPSSSLDVNFWLVVILTYYFLATLLPIDKLIGNLYPLFGAALLVMCVGVGGGIFINGCDMPEIWDNFANLHPNGLPIWPLMFVTVSCGAISGFHATQSPIMARCITSERQGRRIFYGAMIAEGVVALVWAAAGVSVYNGTGGLLTAMNAGGLSNLVYEICVKLLGPIGGELALLGVVACPITSGDTAFRSARLTVADWYKIDQKSNGKRLMLTMPLLMAGAALSQFNFQIIWRYFAWSNQTLAMIVLWSAAVYMARHKMNFWVAAIPAVFLSAVSCTYILVAGEGFSPAIARMLCDGAQPEGANLLEVASSVAYPVGIIFAAMCFIVFYYKSVRPMRESF